MCGGTPGASARSSVPAAMRAPARVSHLRLLVPTTDLLLDRGMMGDGVIDIPRIRSWMEAAGYRGAHEVEIFFREDWWRRDPDEVLAACIERHQSCV